MEAFVARRKEVVEKLKILYCEAFLDLIEWYGSVCYDMFAVKAMEIALNDENQWLSYFIYECDCIFERFNEGVFLGEESHPDIKTYEELYFFITGGAT